ncbi:hypothetical protein [Mycobacterium sp. 852002-51057_SCH5723018]|uniref:hypothetical protein n=1 Tax=Mycobacterium sp. 852002-51057_SCH5723018 TaxID=1834094 RepID=UPI0012E75FD0|nr:hypothetical protein [Mycobacterium sp. 852002-51057_SCH5723018]
MNLPVVSELWNFLRKFGANLLAQLQTTVAGHSPSSADLTAEDFERDELLRRIPSLTNDDFYAINTQTGERQLTSACFKLRPDESGLSVYSKTVIDRLGLTYAAVCRKPLNAVASISGTEPPRHGLRTDPDPWPEDVPEPEHPRNAAHALIMGIAAMERGQQRDLARAFAAVAVIVHTPTG